MKLFANSDPENIDSYGRADRANSDDRAVAKAHFEAAALHAATYELHMLAGATFVQGDPELAGYYARVGAGESDRAQALSHHALALSMPDARAQR